MPASSRAVPLVLLACCLGPAWAEDPAPRPAYPETRRTDDKDVLHGVDVPDPYRWLEDDDAKEVEAWDLAQNALLRKRLDACPRRAELQKRLERELDLGGIESLPRFAGRWAFYTIRAAGKNHPTLYRRPADAGGEGQLVLDPNTWSEDGTQGLGEWWPSRDGRLLVYGRDAKGSEEITLHVRDVDTGKDLPDVISRCKFTSVAWREDGRSFYYERQPEPDDVPAGEQQYHRRIRLHVLGTQVQDDPILYGQGRPLLESAWIGTSTDERTTFLVRGIGYETLDTFELEETGSGPRLEPLLIGNDSRTYMDRVGDLYVLNTDFLAPRRRVCVAERGRTQNPAHWREIVPQDEGTIDGTYVAKDRIAVVLKQPDLSMRIRVFSLDGKDLGDVKLPGVGRLRTLATRVDDPRLWFTFESYSVPMSNWVVNLSGTPPTGGFAPEVLASLPTTVKVEDLVSEVVRIPSKDGTPIPVYLLRKKDTPLDGSAPTVLYAYGGFRVSMLPAFSRSWAVWAEQGGVYAVASLRGGTEFGEEWHEQGSLGKKQNVFDDFIAVADGLVAQGKAKRETLAIMGGSNGGLLVATVANQRPDLCRAVVCSVPLTDMLRYHRFQYAKLWTKEYGDPDVKEHFGWIQPYSPYHNVKQGAAYPAAMVTAGLKDGRVDAFHARKIVAQWQRATSSTNPILLYLDRESGHGSASMKQAKAEILDRFCFLLMELGAPRAR